MDFFGLIRERLRLVFVLVVSGALVAILLVVLDPSSPPSGYVFAASLEDFNDGEVIYNHQLRLFLVRVEEEPGVLALSAISPHRVDLGERLFYCESAQIFQAIHSEAFDRYGIQLVGPRGGNLDSFAALVVNSEVYINPKERIDGSSRVAKPQSVETSFCNFDSLKGGSSGYYKK